MAPRIARRRSRSQSAAQLRIPFRNVREVAGTTVLFPDWAPAPSPTASVAVVLHLADAALIGEYLQVLTNAATDLDVFIVLPEAAPTTQIVVPPRLTVEVLVADPIAANLYQLTALINSDRLVGYRTVVRHVGANPGDVERLARFPLTSIDSLVHSDVDRGGLYLADDQMRVAVRRDVTYRVSQLLKRIATRFRNVEPGELSLSTVALRGAALEFLRPLRIDHQDFFIDYAKYIHEGQATEYLQPAEADRFAGRAVECTLYVLLDAAGLRLEEVDLLDGVQGEVPAGTQRATAWATYHPDLSTASKTRNATWSHLAGSMPMYLGHQLPLAPGLLGFADPLIAEDRARQTALARSAGISGFLVLANWGADGLDPEPFFESLEEDEDFPWAVVLQHSVLRRINPYGGTARLAPWVDPGSDTYQSLASRLAELAGSASYLKLDGRPVIVIQDLTVLSKPALFVDTIRDAVLAATGTSPWIAVAETPLTTSRPGGPTVPEGLDGVIQLPPVNSELRHRLRIGGRFGGFTGPVFNLAPAGTGTAISIEARENANILPGALVAFDTTPELRSQGTVGYNWNVATFRRMLESAVRSVAWREESRRIVVINSWNGWSDTSQLEPSHHRGESYVSAVADTLYF